MAKVKHLKDYQPPDYLISKVILHFDLDETKTQVRSGLTVSRRDSSASRAPDLVLNGEQLKLLSVRLNGKPLDSKNYILTEETLTISNPPNEFTLEIENEINPSENHALEGLYLNKDVFCTQNEPEGFRKITYFLDRPDVMAKYRTTIMADQKKYPVLLSNGNPIEKGNLPNGRHFVTWGDPFAKPSYLFALVAGNLGVVKDRHTTHSGRMIDLSIYVDLGNESKCSYAMECLKRAMEWDEETFGLECDLNTYMIVAVDAFNMGAMENKGLNIFNSQYILADPKTATDANYEAIESVIGHEYFHNWTGNRVTCRDWFQITLKEGLTIFRDQEFSADMNSRPVKRITDVRLLRDHQFVEDASPNAHPIRPESYLEINNFYTVTVYEKGSEVIRMIETLIGKEIFQRGITKYFELFDGKAVTTDDFVCAMELASGRDLTQFKSWYSQAGTPICQISMDYDQAKKKVTLTVRQKPPKLATNIQSQLSLRGLAAQQPGRSNLESEIASARLLADKSGASLPRNDEMLFYFPLSVGFLDASGKEILKTQVLAISKSEETFEFSGIQAKPIPSLLRNFSAPVQLEYDYSTDELLLLFCHDTDAFNRYEAGQKILTSALEQLISAHQKGESLQADKKAVEAFGLLLADEAIDLTFKTECLVLPSLVALTERMEVCDFEAAFKAREFLKREIANKHESLFKALYHKHHDPGVYRMDSVSIGKRTIKNLALGYLLMLGKDEYLAAAIKQFEQANNMTDEICALSLLCDQPEQARAQALQVFCDRWSNNPLVMNKWFAVQAASKLPNVLEEVKKLEQHSSYDSKNPNKIRALIGAFTSNLIRFHNCSGEGYRFVADKILEVDTFNSIVASRLADAFKKFRKLDEARKTIMTKELERILSQKNLSRGVFELVSKLLGR